MRSAIGWDRDAEGVVTLTLDDPDQRVNTLNALFTASFAAVVDRLEAERDDIAGVILRSAKSSFLAGGDLRRLAAVEPADRAGFLADLEVRKSRYRRLERLGRPVVAVLAGAALGGGLELALVCHHRIAVDDSRVVVGLPEVTLGLLPGGGGVVRTVLGLGPGPALDLILAGTRLDVAAARAVGLVDATAGDEPAALEAARAWICAHPGASQPWDRGDPARGGDLTAPVTRDPARRAVVDVARAALTRPVEAALRIESEALADLVVGDAAKATIAVVFTDTVRVRGRLARPAGEPVPVTLVTPRTTPATIAAARALAPRIRVLDLAAAPELGDEAERARAGDVVLDVVDGPGTAPTDVTLVPDRIGDGGLVLLHSAEDALADVLPSLARAGLLPVAVRPGRLDLAAGTGGDDPALDPDTTAGPLADVLREALVHPEDVDVVSVRVLGFPPWTGGAARHATRRQHPEPVTTARGGTSV